MKRSMLPVTVATVSLVLAGCSGSGTASTAAEDAAQTDMEVIASFYPLQWVTERVAGDRVAVSSLTPPGAEAHDLELSPRDVAAVSEADMLVYLSGFQPAVDEAAETAEGVTRVDAADLVPLDLAAADDGHGHAGEEEAHAGDEAVDPHFWLDALRLAEFGDGLADRMAQVDPDGAQQYRDNAAELRGDLEALHEEMSAGLAGCESTDLVTSHDAFGYLADRYGFTQVGISGLSPESEPRPAELAEVTDFVRSNDVGTIYFETLVSPDVARTVADEVGAQTATLDPLEGLTEDSAGSDYLEVMRANLATLQQGQSCP